MARLSTFLRTEDNAVGSGLTVYANLAAFPTTGPTTGDQAFNSDNNKIYVWNGNGWFSVATVNQTPTWSTAPESSYAITDGNALAITLEATDPDGFPLTYSYSTSGLSNYATIAQSGADNRTYTITPQNAGTFTLTFTATDGVNSLATASSFEIVFIIDDSAETSFLLKATGTGGNQSPTDASASSHAITANGSTTLGSFSPYRNQGYSIFFDGSDDEITVPDSDDFNIATGNGDFTIECWIYKTKAAEGTWFSQRSTSTVEHRIHLDWDNSSYTVGSVAVQWDSGEYEFDAGIRQNEWQHIAWVRSGTTLKWYTNGELKDSRSEPATMVNISAVFDIGAWSGSGRWYGGYIADFRFVNGTAVYSANFSPPTTQLSKITNTKLLLQGPGIFDKSDSRHAVTTGGVPASKPWTPYDRTKYTAAGNAGSAHFDGNGDYLQIADNADFDLAGEFAYEFWLYRTGSTSGTYQAILGSNGSGSNGLTFYITQSNGALGVFQGSFVISGSAGDIKDNVWHHVLLMRDSSNLLQLFIDGIRVSSSTNTTTFSDNSAGSGTRIGYDIGANGYFEGFLSDIRLVKGSTGGYSSGANITVPTIPLSAVTNTKLLLNMGQAGVFDGAGTHNLNPIGNVAGSSTQQKFSGKNSIAFDGANDYIELEDNTNQLGTNDFTIESYVYPTSLTSTHNVMFSNYNSYGAAGTFAIFMPHSSATSSFSLINEDGVASGGSLSYNQWYHVAATRSGNILRLYVDGAEVANRSHDTHLNGAGTTAYIGASGDALSTTGFPGYMQDFRITKDLVRYPYIATPVTLTQTNSGMKKPDGTFPSATASNTILLACHTSNPVTEGSSGGYDFTNNNGVAETTTAMPLGAPAGMTGMQFTASSSMYLDNNNSEIPALGTGDWTIEYWVWHDTLTADQTHIAIGNFNPAILYDDSASKWSIYNGAHHYITTVTPQANKWYHFAWVHNNTDGKIRIFVNGAFAQEYTENFNISSQRYRIGRDGSSSAKYMNGTISNMRVVKGQALYTQNFTPPTSSFNG